ncbi:MAG TPA: hypothetical protein VFZ27_17875 [Terriglobia bacterium]|nr:hypothetical protein [Terriglobia bacterium]
MIDCRKVGFAAAVLLALAAAACSSGTSPGSTGSTTPPPSNVSVSISPASSTVGYGATRQFKATVTGAGNTAVSWSVSSSVSSSSSQIGAISSSGLYTAPVAASVTAASAPQLVTVTAGSNAQNIDVAVPALNSVDSLTVTATSQADSSQSASATVTLTGLSILAVGQCVQSTADATKLDCSAGSTGTEIQQGQTVFLFVAGFGIVPGTNYCISGMGTGCTSGSGTDVVVTPPLPNQFQMASDGTPVVYFQVSVLPGAAPGPRNLVVRNSGNELSSFAGAVDIIP